MEVCEVSKDELWSLLDDCKELYTRYVILSTEEITSTLPGIEMKTLPFSWILDPAYTDLLKKTSYTRDEGWFCTIIHGSLNLTLNQNLYTQCGLQCSKSRTKDGRDLFTFTCNMNNALSQHNQQKLQYCFNNVLKFEYNWIFGTVSDTAPSLSKPIKLPLTVQTHELLDVIDKIGGALLDISPLEGEISSEVQSSSEGTESCDCLVYNAETLVTGHDLVKRVKPVQNIRVLVLYPLPTVCRTTKHVVSVISGAEGPRNKAYLVQYEVR